MSGKTGGAAAAAAAMRPTSAEVAAAVHTQKSLMQKLDAEISNIVENFSHLVSICRANDLPVRNSQDCFQMEVRTARMTQAADSLLKLVSELKQTAMFSGFVALNENVDRMVFDPEMERLLERIGKEMATSLKELETHYYGSVMGRNDAARLSG